MRSRPVRLPLTLAVVLAVGAAACSGTGELRDELEELRAEQAAHLDEERALRGRVEELEESVAVLIPPASAAGDDPLADLEEALAELEDRVTELDESTASSDEAAAAARDAADAAASDLRATLDEVRGSTEQVRGELEELRTLYETLRDRVDRMQSG
ncbi:MAG: hypothetical protein WEB03_11720 [Nitriliruptor sp.]|uniref:hypothetical protein n=1 Tax=Nitriliruptor sp. TaxID=2448056 RepID=UPI0034A08541